MNAAPQIPVEIEIEQALLGTLLVRQDRIADIDELKAAHFSEPLHGRIFEVMLRKFDRELAITPLTLKAAMKNDPGAQEIGMDYFINLAQAAPAAPNIKAYAQIIRETSTRRRLMMIGEDLINDAAETADTEPTDKIADRAAQAIYDATANSDPTRNEPKLLGEFGWDAVKAAELAIHQPDDAYLTTGMRTVDEELGPLYRGDEIVLAGATSMGKTALAEDIFIANGKLGHVGLFFSLEMPGAQLAARNISQRAEVSADKIRRGKLTTAQFEAICMAPGEMMELPLYVDESPSLSVAQIASRCLSVRRKAGALDLVIIDHLQFIEPLNPKQEERDQLRQITRDLKRLAKRLNVALVLLCHITKENERRSSKRPVLADLYGSVGIQQNADVVIFVHREEYYLERERPDKTRGQKAMDDWLRACEENKGWAEIFAAKVRMGKLGTARVRFEGRFTKFSDPEGDSSGQLDMDMAALAGRETYMRGDPGPSQ